MDAQTSSPLSSSSVDTMTHFSENDMSTEDLLLQYLQQHYSDVPAAGPPSPMSDSASYSQPGLCRTPFDLPSVLDTPHNVQLNLSSYSDLQAALVGISYQQTVQAFDPFGMLQTTPGLHMLETPQDDTTRDGKWTTDEETMHVQSTELSVPSSIRLNVESSHMLDSLMSKAVTHWCCIGFKVAPISLDMILDWHKAPPAIVYCVASISLVTFMDHKAGQAFIKQAAMVFYEQARHKMDDVFLDDMHPSVIQAYFCLSYTSNLLRLYEQQRTWSGLASIALQQHAKDIVDGRPVDRLTMMCWLRWYYVDAWMCLTRNRECLLNDDTPLGRISMLSEDVEHPEFRELYRFASLTRYMRMYIRAIRSGKMFADGVGGRQPSALYHNITQQLKHWYASTRRTNDYIVDESNSGEVHFHLCYHAVRLIILFQFLHPTLGAPQDILIDCLETNLALLQALRHLKHKGCDQSTYHHMFFAIHNTAKRIYSYSGAEQLKSLSEEQLRMNLLLLRGTQAYINDVFKMRLYAEKIEEQFRDLRISEATDLSSFSTGTLQPALANYAPTTGLGPRIFVFRQQNTTRRSRPNKASKKLKASSPPSSSTCSPYARQSKYAKTITTTGGGSSSSRNQHSSTSSTADSAIQHQQQLPAQIV
ncbi:hypothetical protein O0I10_003210 [Lichtheimia ornata]|uniref:Transcription factor domain-containing protein n=1 Tax=Lichtheimia ornata TaxID=688661 RepID=A0AAD7V9B6_9FUNG|nr:uncharacterized protein O0I10_003210 [Lichtheimia ornata]KAJ8660988.1 hypothetical protein O0I10_003210 [Lichtheimia ornata]